MMLCLNRKLHRAFNKVREGNFALDGLLGFDMAGKVVGVVGTGASLRFFDEYSFNTVLNGERKRRRRRSAGKIGAILCRILKLGFGCDVLAYDVIKSKEVQQDLGVPYVELNELLARSGPLVVNCHQ
jgi:D-lactate dehydrogenase